MQQKIVRCRYASSSSLSDGCRLRNVLAGLAPGIEKLRRRGYSSGGACEGAVSVDFASAGRRLSSMRLALAIALALALVAGLAPFLSRASAPEQAYAANAANSAVVITHQPVGGTFASGATVRLYVQASSPTDGLLAYQWYRSASNSTAAGSPISGATSSVCDNVPASAGTYYYYAEVRDASGSTAVSRTAQVVVGSGSLGTSVENGDFESAGNPTTNAWYRQKVPYWNTTHYFPNAGGLHDGNIFELNRATEKYGITQDRGNWSAELSADRRSTLYQEVATVPGKIYQWSLEHAARVSNVGVGRGVDTMALVIGPATNRRYSGGTTTSSGTYYPYGQNSSTLFQKVVDQIPSGERANGSVHVVPVDPSTGMAVASGGDSYYVYIGSDAMRAGWGSHRGVYTVPEGQGVTVFGFVAVSSAGGEEATGNLLDSITFAQGTGAAITSDVDYSGSGALSTQVADASYRYGILEMRGSTTLAAQGVKATLGTAAITPDGNGWYAPGSTGTLSFSNLTPGKTYRVVAVPKDAINADLGTNLVPAAVLDESYGKDTMVKPASGSLNENIQVTAEIAPGNTARALVRPAREDVEYALLQTTADGSKPNSAVPPAKAWTQVGSGGKQLAFDGLERNHSYALVARPKGYDEIAYAQAAARSYVVFKTPASSFVDASPESVRRSQYGTQLTVTDKSSSAQRYLVYDVLTGRATGGTWHVVAAGATYTWTGLDPSKTYQIVAAEQPEGSTPSPGVRAYPAPPSLAIDYIHETVGKDGAVPSSVEFRMKDTASGTWYRGGENTWVQGSGDPLATLTNYLDDPASRGATLTYRLHAEVQPAVYLEKSVAVPARPAAPAQSATGYAFDYANEKLVPGSSAGAVEARASFSSAWEQATAASPLSLSGLGWTGSQRAVQVRMPAVEGTSFASRVNEGAIVPPRAASPDVALFSRDNGATYAFSGNDAVSSQYREYNAAGTWRSCNGATGLPRGKTYEVRKAATAEAFASDTVLRSASRAQLEAAPGAFNDITYGNAAAPQVEMVLSNLGANEAEVKGAATVTMTRWPEAYSTSGVASKPAFSVIAGAGAVAPGSTTLWHIGALPDLSAGTYEANITINFADGDDRGDATTYHAMTTVSLVVDKATPAAPKNMRASEVGDRSVTLAADVAAAGDPPVEYSTAKASGYGGASRLSGLSPQTCYGFFARTKADANHNASAPVELRACTAYAAPDPSVVKIDYAAETVTYPGGYELRASSDEGAAEIASGSSITDYVSKALVLRLAATGDKTRLESYVPASSWVALSLPARPSISATASSANATDSRTPDGSITVKGVAQFQYRKSSDTSWVTVTGSFMGHLPAGTYYVRTPATGSAFASDSLKIVIAAKNYWVTFDLAGGQGAAPDEQHVALGGTATRPPDPVRTGYAFDGWYADGDSAGWNFAASLSGDVRLSARWAARTYTVTFDANAPAGFTASGTMGAQNRSYDDGATLSRCAFAIPNWEFKGWNTRADGTGDAWANEASGNLTDAAHGAVTLYAVWARPTIEAAVPLKASVEVDASGTFTCPRPLDPADPGAGGYCIESATKGALKVAKIDYALDAHADDLFSKANQVMATVNGAPLRPGQSAPVSGERFRIAPSADGTALSYLPLALGLTYPGGTIKYASEERAFATLTFTLEFDDAAPGASGAGA